VLKGVEMFLKRKNTEVLPPSKEDFKPDKPGKEDVLQVGREIENPYANGSLDFNVVKKQ